MSSTESSLGRKFLFAALYFSQGAPIGFIWWALPVRLRLAEVPIAEITALSALLALPWTFKFLWAPLVDGLRGPRFRLRHWIVLAQLAMGLTLAPLLGMPLAENLALLRWLLLAHAISAATQDVAIDALCISITQPHERGSFNGWMQSGMLLGRSLFGGGALILAAWLSETAIVIALIACTTFSAALVLLWRPEEATAETKLRTRFAELLSAMGTAATLRSTWLGLAFALVGGAAYEALGSVQGPLLVDRGFSQQFVGGWLAGPMVLGMIAGSLGGGYAADKLGHRRATASALLLVVVAVSTVAFVVALPAEAINPWLLPAALCLVALGIGLFVASSYALFMDLAKPEIAGTQFSAFMGATNGCESWSAWTMGQLQAKFGYATGLIGMSAVSLAAMSLIPWLRRKRS